MIPACEVPAIPALYAAVLAPVAAAFANETRWDGQFTLALNARFEPKRAQHGRERVSPQYAGSDNGRLRAIHEIRATRTEAAFDR